MGRSVRQLALTTAALCGLAVAHTHAADEIDVFAVTGSLTTVQQSYKDVKIGGFPDTLLVAKPVTLSVNALINLAQGKPTNASVTGLALGMTCEPSPRIVVLEKNTTAIGDENEIAAVGVITLDGLGVIQEKVVTADGFSYPLADYYIESGELNTASPTPVVGIKSAALRLMAKNTQPTKADDPYPECPLKFEATNLMGELVVELLTPVNGETELVYTVTKGSLSAARTRIGTIDAPP